MTLINRRRVFYSFGSFGTHSNNSSTYAAETSAKLSRRHASRASPGRRGAPEFRVQGIKQADGERRGEAAAQVDEGLAGYSTDGHVATRPPADSTVALKRCAVTSI